MEDWLKCQISPVVKISSTPNAKHQSENRHTAVQLYKGSKLALKIQNYLRESIAHTPLSFPYFLYLCLHM